MPKLRQAIDDHALQGREHREFARSERFRRLPPLVQSLVELHIAAHDFYQGQALMAMQQSRQPGKAFLATPGPAPGSPPSTSPIRGGSSPDRMDGDNAENEARAVRQG